MLLFSSVLRSWVQRSGFVSVCLDDFQKLNDGMLYISMFYEGPKEELSEDIRKGRTTGCKCADLLPSYLSLFPFFF